MAKQRFSNAFREAIWRAFSERCFYCGLPLSFARMEIDHLLPESTSADELNSYRVRLGLPDGFDLFGFDNLAPSCADCNSKKHALLLSDGALMIKLAQIAARRCRLVEEIEKKRVSRDLDAVLRLIGRSIDAEKFSMDELGRGIEWLRKHPDGVRGASGRDRTPPSPEIPYLGVSFLNGGSVVLTARAADDLRRLNMSEHELLEAIRNFGETGQIKPRRSDEGKSTYEVRLNRDLRLSFSLRSESETMILGVHRRGDRWPPDLSEPA